MRYCPGLWLLHDCPLTSFLCCRFGVYVPLCCFHQEGGKSQAPPADCDYQGESQQAELPETPFFRPRDFFFLLRENLRQQFSTPPHMPIHTCPPHTHSHTPELIRAEVEELKSDFNRRIKEVLFNSLFSAYYVAFLPLCFVKVGRAFVLESLPQFGIKRSLILFKAHDILCFVSVCDTSTEHPVLWHALVLRASHYGVDQRVCDADESAAAPELLRPAPPLSRSPGPLAEAGARLIQQCASASVSIPACLHSQNTLLCVFNCGLVVVVDGQKAPFGPKECLYDTVDVCTRLSGLIMLLYPQMSPMPGFTWVFLVLLQQQL